MGVWKGAIQWVWGWFSDFTWKPLTPLKANPVVFLHAEHLLKSRGILSKKGQQWQTQIGKLIQNFRETSVVCSQRAVFQSGCPYWLSWQKEAVVPPAGLGEALCPFLMARDSGFLTLSSIQLHLKSQLSESWVQAMEKRRIPCLYPDTDHQVDREVCL